MSWTITGVGAAPRLLDAYPGAAAAYSFRNLSWAYGGPVVRVRRSSDNTEQDFTAAQITNGTLTTFCGAGDGCLRIWYDQSGARRHLEQTTLSAQSQVVSSGSLITSAGKPAASWYSGNQTYVVPSVPATTALTYFAVKDTSDTDYVFVFSTNTQYLWVASSGSSNTLLTGSVNPGSMRVNGFAQTLTTRNSVYAALNGRKLETTSATIVNWASFQLGGVGLIPYSGLCSEFVLYMQDMTSSVSGIESNINAHYAIY